MLNHRNSSTLKTALGYCVILSMIPSRFVLAASQGAYLDANREKKKLNSFHDGRDRERLDNSDKEMYIHYWSLLVVTRTQLLCLRHFFFFPRHSLP